MRLQKLSPSIESQRGVALVIILAFVVLLTGLVVAFFSRAMTERQVSNSSANQTKVDLLAQGAADIIVGDLKQEIAAGSTVTTVAGSNIYSPRFLDTLTPKSTVTPALIAPGGTAGYENLLKRSAYQQPFYPANANYNTGSVPNRAANVSTLAVSQNGRSITPARWNKSLLLKKADQTASNDTDFNPVGATSPTTWANAPDWVLLSRDGSNPKVWNSNLITSPTNSATVVGRYAFMVYDEGGLLDMNAAGYPTTTTTSQSASKGALAYADLTQLTDSTGATLLPQAKIDNIVGWRNFASASTDWTATPPTLSSSYLTGTFPGSGTTAWTGKAPLGVNYLNYVTRNPKGYLSTGSQVLNAGQSDRMFTSRQQLMKLLLQGIASQAATGSGKTDRAQVQNALQYLGTFSRQVNSPSFYYPTTGIAGNDPIVNSDANLNILTGEGSSGIQKNLRMALNGSAPDGFAWKVGDPVVARRFSLKRLALVKYNAVSTSATSDIYRYFGLFRSSADDDPWTYCGSDGTTTATNVIKTLDQVAAVGREPNFFELLKAAIHKDSIGVTYGFAATGTGDKSRTWVGNADVIDGQTDLQILRIGANIIDQADEDSYPTVIAYKPTADFLYAYGIESLPYVEALAVRSVCDHYDTMSDPGSDARKIRDQFVPVLWNPHREASSVSTNIPSAIQFYMTGKTRWSLIGDNSRNDDEGYKNNTTRFRANEIGLSGFDSSLVSLKSEIANSGSIVIKSSRFGTFKDPNLILKAASGDVTSSGAYKELPFHNTGAGNGGTPAGYKIFGLELNNPVYPSGRAPYIDASDSKNNEVGPVGGGKTNKWNGYFSGDNPDFLHHQLNPGAEGIGMNAVLRYEYPPNSGKFHVYSAFASNQADPDGKIHTNYDAYGVRMSVSNQDGLFLYGMHTENMPAARSVAVGDMTWRGPGGTQTNGGFFGQSSIKDNRAGNRYFMLKADPRTARFGIAGGYVGWSLDDVTSNILKSIRNPAIDGGKGYCAIDGVPQGNSGRATTLGSKGSQPEGNAGKWWPAMWSQNVTANGPGTYCYDVGPGGMQSGKVRPGDDYLASTFTPSQTSTTNNSYQVADSRPVMLNRPFRSVGELGYVFRDMPFKSLDLFSKESVDSGLLDFFTVDSATLPVVAGKININTKQAPVLKAIMAGAFRKEDPTSNVLLSDSNGLTTIAANIVALTSVNPFFNRGELVTKWLGQNVTSDIFNSTNSSIYPAIKSQREAPIRALSEVASTRTWNLLVDVIAQTGRYPSTATALDKFMVEGERRYWLHVAIDRFTGNIVDQQMEPVYE